MAGDDIQLMVGKRQLHDRGVLEPHSGLELRIRLSQELRRALHHVLRVVDAMRHQIVPTCVLQQQKQLKHRLRLTQACKFEVKLEERVAEKP